MVNYLNAPDHNRHQDRLTEIVSPEALLRIITSLITRPADGQASCVPELKSPRATHQDLVLGYLCLGHP
jgi:hypothetical protein